MPICMSVYHVHACTQSPEEGIRSPGTGVTDNCDCLVGVRKPN